MDKDYYGTLGVSKDADADEIRKAYRSEAQKAHPDREGGNEGKFKEIQCAYDVLSDADKRSQHDRGEEVGKRTITLEEKAVTRLMQVFTQSLEGADDHFDLTITVRSKIEVHISSLDENKGKAEEHITRMHHLQGRVSHKGEGTDLFHSLTEQRIGAARDALSKLDEEGKVLARVLQLLDEYECEVEAVVTQDAVTTNTYMGGLGWR